MTDKDVTQIFTELLEIPGIGPNDNFFEAGGNSLLALELLEKVRERSGADLSLLDIIRHPTPQEIAERIG